MGGTDLSVLPERHVVFPESIFRSSVAADIPLRVEGIVGQTSDLMQWKTGDGAIRLSVTKVGSVFHQPASGGGQPLYLLRQSSGENQDFINLQTAGGASSLAAFHSDGTLGLKFGVNRQSLGGLEVHSPAVNLEGINVYGRVSQTADLQTWRNSTGSKLTRVTSTGVVGISHGGSSTAFDTTGTALLFGYADASSYQHGIRTRHHSNQQSGNAVDFYVWKFGTDTQFAEPTARVATLDLAGSEILSALKVVGHTTAAGTTFTGDVAHNQASYFGGGAWWTAAVNVLAGNYGGTGAKGIVVRGSASQTGNLQEWQNSAGEVAASVAPDGAMRHRGGHLISIVGAYSTVANVPHNTSDAAVRANANLSSGIYNPTGTNTDSPWGNADGRWWFLQVMAHIGGTHWQRQIAWDMTGGDNTMYTRRCTGGDPTVATSWTAWVSNV